MQLTDPELPSAVTQPSSRLVQRRSWLLRYLASLTTPRLMLWCYLIWYLFVFGKYFDPSPRLWLSSVGISGIIGCALYVSTAYSGTKRVVLERWQIARLFIMPFCVSSFAALIKGQGFVLVFHPRLSDNSLAVGACVLFWATAAIARQIIRNGPC